MNEKPSSKKLNNLMLIGVVVATIILLASVAYWQLSEPSKEKEKPEETVDERISPYENQALFVEIFRIRNRGLMDEMLSFRSDWETPPSYYYTITVDDETGSAKGYVGETGVYTTWDTIGYESSMPFDVNEERKSSMVHIQIIEEEYGGLLGRSVVETTREKISVRYDYRTGRWQGDDSFMDEDGVGHYLGKTYEVWFNIYQADFDNDGIPFWTEKNMLGTDPLIDDSVLDPDQDGIPTSWEYKWGYNPHIWNDHHHLDPDVDGIDNFEEYTMSKWFADPYQPDIYIETDGMEKNGFFDLEHIFYLEAQQMLIERFAQHGMWVYIDDGWDGGPVNGGGEVLPFQSNLDDILGKQMLAFYTHNFADERKGIFRYVVAGSKDGGFITPVRYDKFDTMYIGNNLQSINTRLSFTPRVIRVMYAKAVLHELGHSIGLMPARFPGIDIFSRRIIDRYPSMPEEDYNGYLTQYYSIMNYQYIYNKPYFFSDETHTYLFDYSDGSNGPPYDQDDWKLVYLPTFDLDMDFYEEPSDENFEDLEVINEYPGVIVEGWEFDEELTNKYQDQLKNMALVKNTDVTIQVFVKTGNDGDDRYNLRVYAMPDVAPVFAVYSLVAEGCVDADGDISFYS